jgi:hypothetical protein
VYAPLSIRVTLAEHLNYEDQKRSPAGWRGYRTQSGVLKSIQNLNFAKRFSSVDFESLDLS